MTTGNLWRILGCALVAAVLQLPLAGRSDAQVSAGVTSAVGRARSMLDGGNGVAARTLLDSLVARTPHGSDDMAEALFWRGALSERASDGERDWKRLVVDVPLSPRVPDALMRLGELEILRGRPDVARAHFERIVRDFDDAPQQARAMVWIARSYFEERDLPHACETVTALKAGVVPEGELRLQTEEMHNRCQAAAAATSTTPATSGAAPAAAGKARYSIQFAAYDTRSQATALVQRLAKRGITARIDGDRKPFRVRLGRYTTKADANAALARLKKQGQTGIVVELGT